LIYQIAVLELIGKRDATACGGIDSPQAFPDLNYKVVEVRKGLGLFNKGFKMLKIKAVIDVFIGRFLRLAYTAIFFLAVSFCSFLSQYFTKTKTSQPSS
jgi:hypothetical protein